MLCCVGKQSPLFGCIEVPPFVFASFALWWSLGTECFPLSDVMVVIKAGLAAELAPWHAWQSSGQHMFLAARSVLFSYLHIPAEISEFWPQISIDQMNFMASILFYELVKRYEAPSSIMGNKTR